MRTSATTQRLSPADAVRGYQSLAQVERAFRRLKGLDLRIRPIFHRTEEHVRAHIFLCLLAYYVEWHLRRAWGELLFADEELENDRATRDPGAPAQPSPAARRKKSPRRTLAGQPAAELKSAGRPSAGLPLHSFADLRTHLAGQCRNRWRLNLDGPPTACTKETDPTPVQSRAFELLRVYPVTGNAK